MKFKIKLLSVVVLIVSCFCLVGLVGCCDKVNIGTLEANYKALQEVYTNAVKDGAFEEKQVDSTVAGTKYYINFGQELQKKIDASEKGYVELRKLYNTYFAISNEFIEHTIDWIIGRKDDPISKATQSAVESLNSALVNYTATLKDFLFKRVDFVYYFEPDETGESLASKFSPEDNFSVLTIFKRTYGAMVDANVNFSLALADAIETTNVYEDINNSEPTSHDRDLIKQYIRAKLLKVFSKFNITEIDSKFNWANTQSNGPAKAEIQKYLNQLDEDFSLYKTVLTAQADPQVATKEEIQTLWEYTQDFLVETNDYYTALNSLNLSAFNAVLFEYKDYDKQALNYMDKIEQYVTISLPEFLNKIQEILN